MAQGGLSCAHRAKQAQRARLLRDSRGDVPACVAEQALALVKEPENEYDPNAVRVQACAGLALTSLCCWFVCFRNVSNRRGREGEPAAYACVDMLLPRGRLCSLT